MRYTECRLSRIATEMLRDIDADTVDFKPNYDESRREPTVLPARPNLLVNGSAGIAVGMATNMPPHRPARVDAILELIDSLDANVDDLMRTSGPDFLTGAIIVGREGIRDAYRTGRGRIVMRARAHIEELRGGKTAIIVTELPYGVKKGGDSGVIAKIAELYKDKVLTEISAVEDYRTSPACGSRSTSSAKRSRRSSSTSSSSTRRFRRPSATTPSRSSTASRRCRCSSCSPLPRHQREVVTRRLKHELRQAEKRAHVLRYLIALDNLDEVIALIRGAATRTRPASS